MSLEKHDYLLKSIIVGDGEVGKTALSVRFTEGKFKDDYKTTIGVDFSVKFINVDNYNVKLQIWDTGGQEQFSYVRPIYYTGSTCGFVVFDKTNRRSFNNIEKWFKEVYDNCGEIPLILVGNKADLMEDVTMDEGQKIAKIYNVPYFETSAKSGESVNLVFETIVRLVIDPKYIDMIRASGIEYKKTQLIYNEAYKQYEILSNKATAYFQAGNLPETLNSLTEALNWAKSAEFEEGILWCEDQIDYVSKQLNIASPIKVNGLILTCPQCNTYFKVNVEGSYSCPQCSSNLVEISTDSLKIQ